MHLDFIPVVQGRPKECKNNIKHIKEWEEKHGEITEKYVARNVLHTDIYRQCIKGFMII